MVPEGWEETTFDNYIDVVTGYSFDSSIYSCENKDIRLLRGDNIVPGGLRWEGVQRWPCAEYEKLKRFHLSEGDFVIAMDRTWISSGLKVAEVKEHDLPCLLVQRVARIRAKSSLKQSLLRQYFSSFRFEQYVKKVQIATAVPHISSLDIRKFPLVLPPENEQQKIAEILSTWDKAIATTEQLLANSQQQKKALMQQLLTGKKRLLDENGKRFEGAWKKVLLGDALSYKQPTPYLVESTEYSEEYKTPVLTAGKTFFLGKTREEFGIYKNNLPVIIFDDFTTDSKFVNFPFKLKSSAAKILVSKMGYDIAFLYEVMKTVRFEVGGHQRHWIKIYSLIPIFVPNYKEQEKIARVIHSFNSDIEALSNKASLLKQEKKALMQQLLTGKRRVKTT